MKQSCVIIMAFCILLCGLSTVALAGHWDIQTADANSTGMDPCLKLDAQGNPHIAYWEPGAVGYAHWDGTQWRTQTIGVGWRPSLALNSAGKPYVCFANQSYGFTCSTTAGSGWSAQNVGYVGTQGWWTSIACDSSGNPCAAVQDSVQSGRNLEYGSIVGGAWPVEAVEAGSSAQPGNMTGDNCSLALDESDAPHIGYIRNWNSQVAYASWTGSSWTTETVDVTTDGLFNGSCLALDAEGNPHMSYVDSQNHVVKYAYRDGTSWITQVVGPSAYNYSTSIALDSLGRPYIAYTNSNELLCASLTGSSWAVQCVDSDTSNLGMSIAVDQSDTLHIAYSNGSRLRYATYVPEPSTLAAFLCGIGGLGVLAQRKSRRI